MTATTPTVSLRLESRPQTLTIVRAMLAGIAEPLALEAELLDDLKTAVSEAGNNVVMHAYGDSGGPMEISLFVHEHEIRVTVDDDGPGMPPDAESAGGIGLSVVRALTEELHCGPGPEGGTRVEMVFAGRRDGQPLFVVPGPAGAPLAWTPAGGDEVLLSISPVALLAPVLGRMTRTLAAIAHFSLDRFSDIYLVTDALAALAARAAAGDRVGVRLSAAERRVTLAIGPFRPGSSGDLDTGTGRPRSPLALLSDELSVDADGAGETLRVVVADRR